MAARVADQLARVADRSTLQLTHYGRKTGTAHQVTIWFAVEDDHLYLATMNATRQWVRNVARTPRVRLRIGDVDLAGRITRLTAQPELLRAYELFAVKYWAMWLLDQVASLLGRSPRTTKTVDTARGAFFRVAVADDDGPGGGRP